MINMLAAFDQVGLSTYVYSSGLRIDNSSPIAGSIYVGSFHQHRQGVQCDMFEVRKQLLLSSHLSGLNDKDKNQLNNLQFNEYQFTYSIIVLLDIKKNL